MPSEHDPAAPRLSEAQKLLGLLDAATRRTMVAVERFQQLPDPDRALILLSLDAQIQRAQSERQLSSAKLLRSTFISLCQIAGQAEATAPSPDVQRFLDQPKLRESNRKLSPFRRALLAIIDELGDHATTSLVTARYNETAGPRDRTTVQIVNITLGSLVAQGFLSARKDKSPLRPKMPATFFAPTVKPRE